MMLPTNVDRYIVVGNPISHSKSPEIHRLFSKQTKQSLSYTSQLIELGCFEKQAELFFKNGGKGMNVTVPFKGDAHAFCNVLTKRAELAEAVNTLMIRPDGLILGDNTDGQGLVYDLTERLGWPLENKNILVLGAGGATTGVLYMLLKQIPRKITIVNRTVSKAKYLASHFSKFGLVEGCGFESIKSSSQFDIIINATSASLSGALPSLPPELFHKAVRVYDMVYSESSIPFLDWAKKNGAADVSDGLGMLIGQAAESFYVWRGVKPSIEECYKHFR